MDEGIEGGGTKASFVADVLNRTLYQLVIRCTRAEGVRNYFDVGVIAYGGSNISSGFSGSLNSSVIHSLSDIEANPLRIEERTKRVSDGAGGLVDQAVKFPVWFEPTNSGGTPMCEAMRCTAEALVEWCDAHPGSYPPTVIHVSDGMSTDGDPGPITETMRLISTDDGEILLFNLHISPGTGESIIFPKSESELPDSHSRLLYRMSSNVPAALANAAIGLGYNCDIESRFFGYKADIQNIVEFFDIGTRAANLMLEDQRIDQDR
jgi:hypothetical protein